MFMPVKPLAQDVDLEIGLRSADTSCRCDLENVLNEAALVAARRNKKVIDAADRQKIVLLQVHLRKIGRFHKEREMVAYHEAGHTISGWSYQMLRVVQNYHCSA